MRIRGIVDQNVGPVRAAQTGTVASIQLLLALLLVLQLLLLLLLGRMLALRLGSRVAGTASTRLTVFD